MTDAASRATEPASRDATPSPDEAATVSRIDASGRPGPSFAHASEAEMARILDFYDVRWEYEPRTFPILWNLDGEVVESFSPDFYLPGLDLFLEMTTLKQRLVRKKNRKLRRLRELYPDIRIKLFYARDFRAMLLKYGRLALADSLSGTLGQVMPDRGRALDVEPGLSIAAAPPIAAAVPSEAPAALSSEPPTVMSPAIVAGSVSGPVAGVRRTASRSRRRRAAAAARSAALDAGSADEFVTAIRTEEGRPPR